MKKRHWKKRDDKFHDRLGIPRKASHGTWKIKTRLTLEEPGGGVVLTIVDE